MKFILVNSNNINVKRSLPLSSSFFLSLFLALFFLSGVWITLCSLQFYRFLRRLSPSDARKPNKSPGKSHSNLMNRVVDYIAGFRISSRTFWVPRFCAVFTLKKFFSYSNEFTIFPPLSCNILGLFLRYKILSILSRDSKVLSAQSSFSIHSPFCVVFSKKLPNNHWWLIPLRVYSAPTGVE